MKPQTGYTADDGKDQFMDKLIAEMIAAAAPRMFAVVQVQGGQGEARVAAWGMAFRDRAVATDAQGGSFASLANPERVAAMYARDGEIQPYLVWVSPPAEQHPAVVR